MFKLIVIVVLAWLIVRAARNLLLAAWKGSPPQREHVRDDAKPFVQTGTTAADKGAAAGHRKGDADVQDAVWEDLP